jgi:hypothetical protein
MNYVKREAFRDRDPEEILSPLYVAFQAIPSHVSEVQQLQQLHAED